MMGPPGGRRPPRRSRTISRRSRSPDIFTGPPSPGLWTHLGQVARRRPRPPMWTRPWLIVDYLVKEKKIRKIAASIRTTSTALDGHLGGKARLKHHDLAYVAEVRLQACRHRLQPRRPRSSREVGGAQAVILQAVYPRAPAAGRAVPRHRVQTRCSFGPSPIVLDKTIELGGKQRVRAFIGVGGVPRSPPRPGAFPRPLPGPT